MSETSGSPVENEDDGALAGTTPSEGEQEALESDGPAKEVVESKDEEGPTKTPGG